jgi:DnaJ-class molecular chaperone
MFREPRVRKVTDPKQQCPKCDGYGDQSKLTGTYGRQVYDPTPCEECNGTGQKKDTGTSD